LGCCNQFQQFVGIVQPFLELILISVAQRSGGKLGSHARLFMARIRGHKANFVDADSLRSGERGFQLQGEFRRFGFAGRKCMREPAEFFFGDGGKELNAGKARRGEQLRKLLFRRSTFQRHAIQQKLRTCRSKQQSALRAEGDRCVQLFPGDVELFDGTGVFVAVESGILQQDIQASYECASCRRFWICYFHPAVCKSWIGLPH
jgi:hypothetical protein